jgi:hypothetical protein
LAPYSPDRAQHRRAADAAVPVVRADVVAPAAGTAAVAEGNTAAVLGAETAVFLVRIRQRLLCSPLSRCVFVSDAEGSGKNGGERREAYVRCFPM